MASAPKKLLIVGDKQTGKTSLVTVFKNDTNKDNSTASTHQSNTKSSLNK